MVSPRICTALAAAALVCLPTAAPAAFHFMQIEQVIGGVNGDETAQAIQLRMRAAGQNFVSITRLVAHDAAGQNPIVVSDLNATVVGGAGRRILIASPSFADYVTTPLDADFTLTSPIPASYLAAGRLTFETDFGDVIWSLAWGGANYTGSNLGNMDNDIDGNFGPPWSGPLPSTSRQALQFQGAASALSTNNLANYALTSGDAVFINNALASFQVVSHAGDANGDGIVNGADFTVWGDSFGTFSGGAQHSDGDFNHDGFVDGADFTIWGDNFGFTAPGSPIPEPSAALLLACGAFGALAVRRTARKRTP